MNRFDLYGRRIGIGDNPWRFNRRVVRIPYDPAVTQSNVVGRCHDEPARAVVDGGELCV